MSADKLYVNGSIFTVNKDREWAEAVAVEGNKIVYVGDRAGADAVLSQTVYDINWTLDDCLDNIR